MKSSLRQDFEKGGKTGQNQLGMPTEKRSILYLDWCFHRRCHWRYCCHGLNADMVFDSSIAKAKKLKEDMLLLVLGTWGFLTDATPTGQEHSMMS